MSGKPGATNQALIAWSRTVIADVAIFRLWRRRQTTATRVRKFFGLAFVVRCKIRCHRKTPTPTHPLPCAARVDDGLITGRFPAKGDNARALFRMWSKEDRSPETLQPMPLGSQKRRGADPVAVPVAGLRHGTDAAEMSATLHPADAPTTRTREPFRYG